MVIRGHNMPGVSSNDGEGGSVRSVVVGVQERDQPIGLVAGDSRDPEWVLEVKVVENEDGPDFRGPVVHGRKGDRFLYLVWGALDTGTFVRFGRAKLMLNRIDASVLASAQAGDGLFASVDLSDRVGRPRCGRVDPPAIEWSQAR